MVDLFQVAEILRDESPEDFKVLTKVPVIYENVNSNKRHFQIQKTHIEVDYNGKVVMGNESSNLTSYVGC